MSPWGPTSQNVEYEVIDSDLVAQIGQLRKQRPSHIVLLAIHLKKEDLADMFEKFPGTEAAARDPQFLTEAVRLDLRETFLGADAGLMGVPFAIAEVGGFVACTNEGKPIWVPRSPSCTLACSI